MGKIESLIVALHSFQHASRNRDRSGGDDIDDSAKRGTATSLGAPPFCIVAACILFFGPSLSKGEYATINAIAAVILYYGISSYADRVYDQNASHIRVLGVEILDDPDRGRNWARRKIAGITLINSAFFGVVALLGRSYFVYGTDLSFIPI